LDVVANKIMKNPVELESWPPTGGDRWITGGKHNAILVRDKGGTTRVWAVNWLSGPTWLLPVLRLPSRS
jgi:hypothetical protein